MTVDETIVVDTNAQPVIQVDSQIVALRDEMNKQFNTLKGEFATTVAEKDSKINELQSKNLELQRAIVRSAIVDPPKVEVVKTEADIYKERIDALAKKTLALMPKR
jgi:hypothetical protein